MVHSSASDFLRRRRAATRKEEEESESQRSTSASSSHSTASSSSSSNTNSNNRQQSDGYNNGSSSSSSYHNSSNGSNGSSGRPSISPGHVKKAKVIQEKDDKALAGAMINSMFSGGRSSLSSTSSSFPFSSSSSSSSSSKYNSNSNDNNRGGWENKSKFSSSSSSSVSAPASQFKQPSQLTFGGRKHNLKFSYMGSDSDDDDLMAVSAGLNKQKEAKERAARNSSPLDESNTNKQDDDDFKPTASSASSSSSSSSSASKTKSSSTPSAPPRERIKTEAEKRAEEGLWDDGDDILPSSQPRETKKGAKPTKTSSSSFTSSSSSSSKSESSRALVISDIEPLDETGDDDDLDQEDRLHPFFQHPKLGPPSPLEPLELVGTYRVPASQNRYLKDYQREGILFMLKRVGIGEGAILGDDMGLGKTVQIICLLTALFRKSGTGTDLRKLKDLQKAIQTRAREEKDAEEHKWLKGEQHEKADDGEVDNAGTSNKMNQPKSFGPVLLVVPASVTDNWISEFKAWSHFSVAAYKGNSERRDLAIEYAKNGMVEVVVVGKSLFGKDEGFAALNSVNWKLVIVDEFHEYKNSKTMAFKNVELIGPKYYKNRSIIGLTGTPMQNEQEELWCLCELISPGSYGTLPDFKSEYVMAIKASRKKDAKQSAVNLGDAKVKALQDVLNKFYLARKKKDVLSDTLTTKDENVIFTELTPVQKLIYQNILSLPDYQLLIHSDDPCDCSVNVALFQKFRKLKTEKQKKLFEKNNEFVKRKKCCYKIPLCKETNEIDPGAALWRKQHPNDLECERCPGCLTLPLMSKLYKISSHPSLILAKNDPDQTQPGLYKEKEIHDARHDYNFAVQALPPHLLNMMPTRSHIRSSNITDDNTSLSGKLKTLAIMCKNFRKKRDRVLIFSQSTQSLDIINNLMVTAGYKFLRLDGTTPTGKRQHLVDEFQNDDTIFAFLISTRAGGMGLNLTAANRVIVYDVNWNPSYDEQAQDRAYRIGQKRDVQVYRLVARGTIEELMYMRQIYKVHLKTQTLTKEDKNTSGGALLRLFSGVAKDNKQKGELFGLHNLLKYKDGSFMAEIWAAYGHSASALEEGNDNNCLSSDLEVYNEKKMASLIEEAADKAVTSGEGVVNDDSDVSLFDTLGINYIAINQDDFMKRDDHLGEEDDIEEGEDESERNETETGTETQNGAGGGGSISDSMDVQNDDASDALNQFLTQEASQANNNLAGLPFANGNGNASAPIKKKVESRMDVEGDDGDDSESASEPHRLPKKPNVKQPSPTPLPVAPNPNASETKKRAGDAGNGVKVKVGAENGAASTSSNSTSASGCVIRANLMGQLTHKIDPTSGQETTNALYIPNYAKKKKKKVKVNPGEA